MINLSKSNILAFVKKEGFTCVENVFSEEQINLIVDSINLEKATAHGLRIDKLPTETRIWQVEKISEEVKAFLKSDFVLQVENIFRQKVSFAIYNHVWAGDGPGSGGGWHRDTRFTPQYKVIIYLTDCQVGNGNYRYVKGSHKTLSKWSFLKIIEVVRKPRYDFLKPILDKYATNVTGKAGVGIISNTVGLHCGSKVLNGYRKALTLYFDNGVQFK